MPSQTVGNVHISAPLTNLARLYRPTEFIADIVCARLPVVKETDSYYLFDQGPFFATDVDDLVPDRGEAKVVEFSHTTAAYQTAKRALGWDITDRERANSDAQLNLERNKQNGTLGRLLLKREARVAALLRKTTNGGGLTAGASAGAKWDAATTDYQDLATDVMTGKTTMRQAIGASPNVIVIPAAVAEGMHKSLLFEVLKFTYGDARARNLIEQEYPVLPPQLFGMRVLTPGQIQNTAKEGQTATYTDVWGEAVRMLYVTNGPAIEEPSVAYTFQSRPLTTRRWREEKRELDGFEVGFVIVEKVVAPDAGYEINDCLT
jgi:hypothetical protein